MFDEDMFLGHFMPITILLIIYIIDKTKKFKKVSSPDQNIKI